MAKIIEFFIPGSFRTKATKWIPPEEYGKVIPFGLPQKKSAWPWFSGCTGRADPPGQPSET